MTPHTYHQYYLACINDGGLYRRITDSYRGYRGPLNRHSCNYSRRAHTVDSFCRNLSRQFCLQPVPAGERDELYHAVIFRLLNGEDHQSVKESSAHAERHVPPGLSAEVMRDVAEAARLKAEMERLDERAFRKNREFVRNYAVQSAAADRMIFELGNLADLELRTIAQLGTPCTATGSQSGGSANTQTLPKTNKGAPMTTNIKIEQRTFLNGSDVSHYTDAQLISLIEQAEAEIERLRKVKTKSAKITGRIDELKANAAALAELLDTRTNSK